MRILDSGRERKAEEQTHRHSKSTPSPGPRPSTHLWEVGRVQQGSNLKFVEELGKVFKDAAGSGEQVAEAGHDVQQGAERAAGFHREQSLKGKHNTT